MKQIKFKDFKDNTIHGGILLINGDAICGCCGGLLKANDNSWKIIEKYDDWIDLDETICGDDLCEEEEDWVDDEDSD